MILSSAELHNALDAGRLIIRPEPKPRLPAVGESHCPYDTHSVDLTLSPEISVPEPGSFAYDLTQGGLAAFISKNSKKDTIEANKPFKLSKGINSSWG